MICHDAQRMDKGRLEERISIFNLDIYVTHFSPLFDSMADLNARRAGKKDGFQCRRMGYNAGCTFIMEAKKRKRFAYICGESRAREKIYSQTGDKREPSSLFGNVKFASFLPLSQSLRHAGFKLSTERLVPTF